MITRLIEPVLLEWAVSPRRKPLVLRGARQTGKTTAVRQLGRSFDLCLELDLLRYPERRLVESATSASALLEALAFRAGRTLPARTLLFLDEVQACPRAAELLRYLHEDHPEIAVVAAGSLLEVRMQERGFSFPVGRVEFRHLKPLSFAEFIGATLGPEAVATAMSGPVSGTVHELLVEQLRDYALVGGMPEAVALWAERRVSAEVRVLQRALTDAFAEDLTRHRGPNDSVEAVYHALPHHYGRRFKQEGFVPGLSSPVVGRGLDRLESAMLIRRVLPTSSTAAPFVDRPRSARKLLPLDVGLALAQMGVPFEDVRSSNLDAMMEGRVAEMLAGVLMADDPQPLHFWVREGSEGAAELDYLLPGGPVEVKAGRSGTLRSLHQYLRRSGSKFGWRLHVGPPGEERHQLVLDGADLDYTLASVPLYRAERIRDIQRPVSR